MWKPLRKLFDTNLLQSQLATLKSREHDLHLTTQALTNALTGLEETENAHYIGSKYRTYDAQVDELAKKYAGTAAWGALTAKNIIDVRAAFITGTGVIVRVREGFTGNADRELEFIRRFMRLNEIDGKKPQVWGTEAEIEGKALFRVAPVFDPLDRLGNIRVTHVPWRKYKYTITAAEPDFEHFIKADYASGEKDGFSLEEGGFVYARFGGNSYEINLTPPKSAFVLRHVEDLDKELWDWRKINHLFAAPTPHFDCEDPDEARRLNDYITAKNWRIGKAIVTAQTKFSLVCSTGEGFNSINKAIESDIQVISGTTGVPVHFLGHPELLSNRSCYSEDTETLTENGWKMIYDFLPDEKVACFDPQAGKMVFEKPIGLYAYPYEGEMLHFETGRVDILVTPDHKMWANRAWSGNTHKMAWGKIEAQELAKDAVIRFKACSGWESAKELDEFNVIPHNSEQTTRDEQPTRFDADVFLEFLGYYLSEGGTGVYRTTPANSNKYHTIVHVGQKAGAKSDKIGACIEKLGLKFNMHLSKTDGCIRWHIHHFGLHTLLKAEFGISHLNKQIPAYIRDLSTRQLRILFDALMLGDGFWDERPNRTSGLYYTTSKRLAGDIQEIALKLGYSSIVKTIHDERNPLWATEYRVYIRGGKDCEVRGKTVKKINYDGVVYCFSTPTGLFFTRRNGKVAIQGNTADTLLQLIELSTDKERDIWKAAYTELFRKSILLYNNSFQNNLDPDAIVADLPVTSTANLVFVEKVYLPMYMAGALSLETLLSYLTDVNLPAEIERVKAAQEEKEAKDAEKLKLIAEQKNAAVDQGRTSGNGGK